jgi:predicted MFS family arabinose efflux permease
MNSPTKPAKGIPGGIWALGFVSLLMDVSSELIHSLLPVFMFTALGMSVFTIGLIEGAAQATALIVKIFSGAFSDYWGKRKPLAVLGYGLAAASKPLFALATGAGMVVAARLTDRVGKGIRGAPRDALVADFAPPELRGAAFGLRQSLDTVGAFLGPLLAMGLMLLWANDFRTVFWIATFPLSCPWRCWSSACTNPMGDRMANPSIRSVGRTFAGCRPNTGGWWALALCSL